jgi:hypothetical protein
MKAWGDTIGVFDVFRQAEDTVRSAGSPLDGPALGPHERSLDLRFMRSTVVSPLRLSWEAARWVSRRRILILHLLVRANRRPDFPFIYRAMYVAIPN